MKLLLFLYETSFVFVGKFAYCRQEFCLLPSEPLLIAASGVIYW